MNREDRILFACARQEFQTRHRKTVEALAGPAVRWDLVAETAERHGVAPIVGANLRRCDADALGMPAELAERMEVAAFENALLKEREAEQLAGGLARLREVGLEAMLLKGAALDLLVYEEPWVARSGDVDLLLRPLPGFEPGPEEKQVRISLYQNGVECDLLEHHDVNMNGVLPISFDRIWRDARPVRVRGVEAWVMAPEDLLISLCINSCRKRFLRLKGLFDMAETVRRLPLDWRALGAKAREYSCEGIVYVALLAAGATVECDLPDGALEPLGVPPLRARLLRGLVAWALRTTSVTAVRGPALSLLLPYASYRWDQAWRSFRFALTRPFRPPRPMTRTATL